jgi:hypothetical protein
MVQLFVQFIQKYKIIVQKNEFKEKTMLTNKQQKEVLREITRVTMESLAYGHNISSILSKVDNVLLLIV